MMTRLPRTLLLTACSAVLACAAMVGAAMVGAADAQVSDGNVSFQSGFLAKKPKSSGLPDVKPQPQAWPRLDPGAALCRTEDDLERLAARRGGQAVDGPVDCEVIQQPTAITVVQRKGPGATEVAVTGLKDSEPGWTDVWLPDKAPVGAPVRAKAAAR